MRYFAAVLAAMLISVPAVAAAGGPDALSIAQRALRLAKQPPKVTYVVAESPYFIDGDGGIAYYRATCPRGTVVISAHTDFGGEALWGHRRATAERPSRELSNFGPPKALTAVCLHARYVGTVAG